MSVDSQRFQELFFAALKSLPKGSLPAPFSGAFEEAEISYYADLCPIQDSLRYRARRLGIKIANWLIDEKGELDRQRLVQLNHYLKQGFYWVAPQREADAFVFDHLRGALQMLEETRELEVWLKKFSPPLCHKKAEAIIRDTLWLPFDQEESLETARLLQPAPIRRAVLGAWLTFLRQSTGSCFATAPAILIQQKYPLRFFQDLYELLTTGRLKRVMAGKEYMVPMSLSSGSADLQKPLSVVSLDILAFSPGLIAACEAARILDALQSFPGKIEVLRRLLHGLEIPNDEEIRAEKIIRILLLRVLGLEEKDLEEEAYLSRIQMTPLLARQSAVYYQKPSERAQKVSDFKKRFHQACRSFLAFTECSLLRVWEYTIASFCDVKVDFARWNLSIGLGLHPEQPGGIGSFLFRFIDGRLQQYNQETSRLHEEYERAIATVRAAEAMISNSTSEAHRNQLRVEMTGAIQWANSLLDQRDQAAEKAQALVEFFSTLMKQYDEKMQEYFQESFDPSLTSEERVHLFDDSQAGFRLVYKHGRSDASQWTPIDSGEEYINTLRDFFSATERDLTFPPQLDFSFISEMTTALVQFIQEPEFLTSALQRSKSKGRNSPWEYFSGGTMETLMQAYCGKDQPFAESSLAPHSEAELLAFLFKEEENRPLLMRSPTHAFIFYPELLRSRAGRRKAFPKENPNDEMQEHLSHLLSERLPALERALFLHLFRQKPPSGSLNAFRLHLIDAMQGIKNPNLKNRTALVDSLLFENHPLVRLDEAKERVACVLQSIASISKQQSDPFLKKWEGIYKGPYEIYQKALLLILEIGQSPISQTDWEMKIADCMRDLSFCDPNPLLFADTNWSGWFFGFLQNPATGQLELWRLNRTAMQGFPMTDWKEWLNEKNSSPWFLLKEPLSFRT